MCYVDTAYILALIKNNDVWQSNAEEIKQRVEEKSLNLWTSELTFMELFYRAEKLNKDYVRWARNAVELVDLPEGINKKSMVKAAIYMERYDLDKFDSFHMAISIFSNARMITSDREIMKALRNIPDSPRYINLRSPNPQV